MLFLWAKNMRWLGAEFNKTQNHRTKAMEKGQQLVTQLVDARPPPVTQVGLSRCTRGKAQRDLSTSVDVRCRSSAQALALLI